MLTSKKRTTTLAVLVGTLGATGAAHAAGFGGPAYYAGFFDGISSGKGVSHIIGGAPYDIAQQANSSWGLLGGVTFRNGPYLLGGELDYSFGSSRDVSGSNPTVIDLGSSLHLLGRWGYHVNKFDLFLTGGVAAIQTSGNTYTTPATSSVTVTGYSIGAGADYTVARQVVVRLQVLQDYYGGGQYGNGYGINNWDDTTLRAAAIFQF